jgi:hypothetical protein
MAVVGYNRSYASKVTQGSRDGDGGGAAASFTFTSEQHVKPTKLDWVVWMYRQLLIPARVRSSARHSSSAAASALHPMQVHSARCYHGINTIIV